MLDYVCLLEIRNLLQYVHHKIPTKNYKSNGDNNSKFLQQLGGRHCFPEKACMITIVYV